jgi:hypothetical protein
MVRNKAAKKRINFMLVSVLQKRSQKMSSKSTINYECFAKAKPENELKIKLFKLRNFFCVLDTFQNP